MPRPCAARHPEPLTDGSCPTCRLYLKSPRYRRAWDRPARPHAATPPRAAPKPAPAALSCVHRGGPTGETRKCGTCTKTQDVPLLVCAEFGVCTTAVLAPGVQCCRICKSRRAEATADAPS